jgi:hypothetical protein
MLVITPPETLSPDRAYLKEKMGNSGSHEFQEIWKG